MTIREMETKTSNSIYVDEQENRIQLTNSTNAVVSPLSLSSVSFLEATWSRHNAAPWFYNPKELSKTPATQEIANQAPE